MGFSSDVRVRREMRGRDVKDARPLVFILKLLDIEVPIALK